MISQKFWKTTRRDSRESDTKRPSLTSIISEINYVRRGTHSTVRGSQSSLATSRAAIHKCFTSVKLFYDKWHLKHLVPVLFILLYTLLGASLFFWLEADAEKRILAHRRRIYLEERHKFIEEVESLFGLNMDTGQMLKVEDAVDRMIAGIEQIEKPLAISKEPQWSFTASMYFSGTIFTTIGYGDIACVTSEGRMCTVLYAIIGIPLMLVTLNDLGKFLYITISGFMDLVTRLLAPLKQNLMWLLSCGKVPRRRVRHKTLRRLVIDPISTLQMRKTMDRRRSTLFGSTAARKSSLGAHFDNRRFSTLTAVSTLSAKLREAAHRAHRKGSMDFLRPLGAHEHHGGSIDPDAELGTSGHRTLDEEDPILEAMEAIEFDIEDQKRKAKEKRMSVLGVEDDDGRRMPVLVAVGFTISWIFMCAGLFKWMEQWTYSESLYFIFISLLTVGLGDVKVSRRDFMVFTFAFVMIGLALMSMCISVIQCSIEDFYHRLLIEILEEYHLKMLEGKEKKSQNAFSRNRLAKLLLPFLSKHKKRKVMLHVQEEARDAGVEIPQNFERIDSLDKIFSPTEEEIQEEDVEEEETEPQPLMVLDRLEALPSLNIQQIYAVNEQTRCRYQAGCFMPPETELRQIPFIDSDVAVIRSTFISTSLLKQAMHVRKKLAARREAMLATAEGSSLGTGTDTQSADIKSPSPVPVPVTPTQPLTPRRFAVHYQLSFPYMDDDVTGMDEEYLASDFYDPTGTS